jgi:hypothetical protein
LGRRRPFVSAGLHRAGRNGKAHTRWLQGTGTTPIIDPHFKPTQRMMCF